MNKCVSNIKQKPIPVSPTYKYNREADTTQHYPFLSILSITFDCDRNLYVYLTQYTNQMFCYRVSLLMVLSTVVSQLSMTYSYCFTGNTLLWFIILNILLSNPMKSEFYLIYLWLVFNVCNIQVRICVKETYKQMQCVRLNLSLNLIHRFQPLYIVIWRYGHI